MSGNCQGTLRCRCVKYNSPVLVAFLSVAPLCALGALCTTNPQIRRQPRRNVALADNARQCMVCTSLVAAPPRCGKAASEVTTEGTEFTEPHSRSTQNCDI